MPQKTHSNQTIDNSTKAAANNMPKGGVEPMKLAGFSPVNNVHENLGHLANNSQQVKQLKSLQSIANTNTPKNIVQKVAKTAPQAYGIVQRVQNGDQTAPTDTSHAVNKILDLYETAKRLKGKKGTSWDELVHQLRNFLPSEETLFSDSNALNHRKWSPSVLNDVVSAAQDWLKKRVGEFFHPQNFEEKKKCAEEIIVTLRTMKPEVGSSYKESGADFKPIETFLPGSESQLYRPPAKKMTSKAVSRPSSNSREMGNQRISKREQIRLDVMQTFKANDKRFMYEVDRGKSNIAILLEYAKSLEFYSQIDIYNDGDAGKAYLKERLKELKKWVANERTRTIGNEDKNKIELIKVVERINVGDSNMDQGSILEEIANEAAGNFIDTLLSFGLF